MSAQNRSSLVRRVLFAAPIAALALSLAACSGPAAERPDADQLAEGLSIMVENEQEGASDLIGPDGFDCIAEMLLDSELSDETLANYAKGEDMTPQADAELATQVVAQANLTCVTPAE